MVQQFYIHGGSWGTINIAHHQTSVRYSPGQALRVQFWGTRLSLRF